MRIEGSDNCFVTDSYAHGYNAIELSDCSSCTGINLARNTIQAHYFGISSGFSNSLIEDCTIQYCHCGIALIDASDNIIRSNYLSSNEYGLRIYTRSSRNQIINNTFLGNSLYNAYDSGSRNIWDDGIEYGNYWSDYTSGSYYEIAGQAGSVDRFPLGPSIITTSTTTSSTSSTNTATNTNSTFPGDMFPVFDTLSIAITIGSSLIIVTVAILIVRNRKIGNVHVS